MAVWLENSVFQDRLLNMNMVLIERVQPSQICQVNGLNPTRTHEPTWFMLLHREEPGRKNHEFSGTESTFGRHTEMQQNQKKVRPESNETRNLRLTE